MASSSWLGSDKVNNLLKATIFQHDCAVMLIELKNTILKMKHMDKGASSQHLEPRPHEKSNGTDQFESNSSDCDPTRAVLVLNLDRSIPENTLREGLIGLFSIYGIVTSVEVTTPFPGTSPSCHSAQTARA